MPTYVIYVITEADMTAAGGVTGSNGSFTTNGSSFTFNSAAMPGHQIRITDNGTDTTTLSSDTDPTNSDGGPNTDNEGTDGETATLFGPDGTAIGTPNQRVAADRSAEMTGSDGSVIQIYEIETFDDIDIYAFSAPLVDGVTYSVSSPNPRDEFFAYSQMICIASGAVIETPRGGVPIDRLRVGDLVTTLDDGPQPIRFIFSSNHDFWSTPPDKRTDLVRVRKDALGNTRDLIVSRQHRLLVQLRHSCGMSDRLVPAGLLAEEGDGRFRFAHGIRSVTVFNLLFDRHQVLRANGAAVESLYPGPQSGMLTRLNLKLGLMHACPGLLSAKTHADVEAAYGTLARLALSRRALRHALSEDRLILPSALRVCSA